MVTISQILIKLGHDIPHAQGWEGDRPVQIPFAEFERSMRNPGAFTLDAKKTIREKWNSLVYYPNLVVGRAPQTGKPVVLTLDPAAAKTLIVEAMPRSVMRCSAAIREQYLKTGEFQ